MNEPFRMIVVIRIDGYGGTAVSAVEMRFSRKDDRDNARDQLKLVHGSQVRLTYINDWTPTP